MLEVNEYFEGSVKSISLDTPGLPATVGVMAKGEYAFGTDCKEVMTVVCGELQIQHDAGDSWQTYIDGQSFEVEANAKFKVKASVDTAYLCKYWR